MLFILLFITKIPDTGSCFRFFMGLEDTLCDSYYFVSYHLSYYYSINLHASQLRPKPISTSPLSLPSTSHDHHHPQNHNRHTPPSPPVPAAPEPLPLLIDPQPLPHRLILFTKLFTPLFSHCVPSRTSRLLARVRTVTPIATRGANGFGLMVLSMETES